MEATHNATLIIIGAWLLIYRVLCHRCKAFAEFSLRITCGASLALIAPLLPWPDTFFHRDLILIPLGVLLSTCHPALMALLAAGPLGIGIGALFWQLTRICRVADTTFHPIVLSILALGFIVPTGIAGPTSLLVLVIPLLGALLVTVGMANFVPSSDSLTSGELLGVSCTSNHAALLFFGQWFVLSLCGVLLQVAFFRYDKKPTDEDGGNGLVASLLPNAQSNESGVPKPDLNNNNRLALITKAIFAEEGADMSYLTENERKLVEVCRKDEEERDRVLWGGGLY